MFFFFFSKYSNSFCMSIALKCESLCFSRNFYLRFACFDFAHGVIKSNHFRLMGDGTAKHQIIIMPFCQRSIKHDTALFGFSLLLIQLNDLSSIIKHDDLMEELEISTCHYLCQLSLFDLASLCRVLSALALLIPSHTQKREKNTFVLVANGHFNCSASDFMWNYYKKSPFGILSSIG